MGGGERGDERPDVALRIVESSLGGAEVAEIVAEGLQGEGWVALDLLEGRVGVVVGGEGREAMVLGLHLFSFFLFDFFSRRAERRDEREWTIWVFLNAILFILLLFL